MHLFVIVGGVFCFVFNLRGKKLSLKYFKIAETTNLKYQIQLSVPMINTRV